MGSPGPPGAEDAGGRTPPERAVPGTPKKPGPGEQPQLVPAVEEEELLREMEELRSENDYLKVSSRLCCRCPEATLKGLVVGGDP